MMAPRLSLDRYECLRSSEIIVIIGHVIRHQSNVSLRSLSLWLIWSSLMYFCSDLVCSSYYNCNNFHVRNEFLSSYYYFKKICINNKICHFKSWNFFADIKSITFSYRIYVFNFYHTSTIVNQITPTGHI